MSSYISWLSVFDKLTIFGVIIFFVGAVILPVARITPIGEWDMESIRIVWLEYWKTSALIVLLLASTAWLSINGKFKSRFLHYTGIGNDIYARFIQKLFLVFVLIFFWEIVIHLRAILTQTINLTRWYYFLSGILIVGLCIDFLFLQRKYKLQGAYQHVQTTIAHEESHIHEGQSFKNLFDQ